MASRTYYVGEFGKARRLTNFTLPWVTIDLQSSFPAFIGNLYDVMADPNDPDKVFAVGDIGQGFQGIAVSVNAGVSWAAPGGNYVGGKTWWEVWVIDSNNIVAVGDDGRCAISNDGGLTFNNTTTFPTPTGGLIGGNAFCVHFTTPLIGVAAFENVALQSFAFRTNDGGITWAPLNGGADLNTVVNTESPVAIYMSNDQQTVVICCQSAIIRSTNGGNTFTMVHDFVMREGLHMTWLPRYNATSMWATGRGDARFTSTNAGVTWTVQNPTTLPGTPIPRIFAAHYHTFNNGFFSQDHIMLVSADSGLTGAISDVISDLVIFAVWSTSIPCYQLTRCGDDVESPGSIIITDTDLAAYVDQIIQIEGSDDCYTVTLSQTCSGSVPVVISLPDGPFATCEDCLGTCYELADCASISDSIITNVDLSALVGQVVQIDGFPNKCWNVIQAGTCAGAVVVTITNTFIDCDACLPVCYTLANCQNNQEIITTSDDLSAYVDMVVQIEGDERCWVVGRTTDPVICDCPLQLPGPIVTAFANCTQCPPPYRPVPSIPFVEPGFETRVCQTQDYLDIKCQMGEAYYNDVVRKRYGVRICCEEDVDKSWLKNEIIDLKEMFDPTVCIPTVPFDNGCCPPCSVTSTLIAFNPMQCPAPQNVTSELEVPLPPCPPPENVTSELIVELPQCTCYEVYIPHPTFANFDYVNCFGAPISEVDLTGTYYVCAQQAPVFTVPVAPNAYIVPVVFPCVDGVCFPS